MQKVFKGFLGLWLLTIFFCLIMGTSIVSAEEKVNINSAPAEMLQILPGVGPAIAERIIAYRTETPFQVKEDIMKVSGIGEATFKKLESLITVE